ncbi:MAG: SprB repeat-containing protein [Flavobacteriales bacterium]|nr:SprB repeat-containing protein [Flavobacteriales bacterium]
MAACALAIAGGAAHAQGLSGGLQAAEYNGYHISCEGASDGSINLTITSGQAPYTYSWSNQATTEDISQVPAGYYRVTITDAAQERLTLDITLLQPEKLRVSMLAFVHGNDYNVSCFSCYNGAINATVSGGVAPFGYQWEDGPTTEDRSSLGAGNYVLTVTDANGCTYRTEHVYLSEPQRDDWTMTGNAGTTPGSQYLGTSDNKDFVFKTNGQERLRLLSNGDIKLFGGLLQSGTLYMDANGVLRSGAFPNVDLFPPVSPCALTLNGAPYWRTDGNSFQYPQCDPENLPIFGTLSPNGVRFITNNETRMTISSTGKVFIGVSQLTSALSGYRLFVEDGIATRDVLVKLGTWPDYVFADGYRLMPFAELREFLRVNRHLPGIPSALEVQEQQGVEVGDLQRRMLQVLEEQALYILQLEEKLQGMEQRLRVLEASTH